MEPIKFDLKVYQGSTLDVNLTHLNQSKRFRKEPTNLTGMSARMKIRRRYSGELVYDMNTSDGVISIPHPEEGTVSLYIPAEDTAMFNSDECLYDIEVYSEETGFVGKLFSGHVILLREVTYA